MAKAKLLDGWQWTWESDRSYSEVVKHLKGQGGHASTSRELTLRIMTGYSGGGIHILGHEVLTVRFLSSYYKKYDGVVHNTSVFPYSAQISNTVSLDINKIRLVNKILSTIYENHHDPGLSGVGSLRKTYRYLRGLRKKGLRLVKAYNPDNIDVTIRNRSLCAPYFLNMERAIKWIECADAGAIVHVPKHY
jgi:hypothetical protein